MRPGHSNMQSRFGCNLAALRPRDSIESGNLGVEKIKTNLPFAPASLLIPAEKWLPEIQTQREREREKANGCKLLLLWLRVLLNYFLPETEPDVANKRATPALSLAPWYSGYPGYPFPRFFLLPLLWHASSTGLLISNDE